MPRGAKILFLGLLMFFVTPAQSALAQDGIQAYIHHITCDCESLDLGITLGYITNDWDGQDFYRLRVFDAEGTAVIASVDGWITADQTPYYWQTGPIPAVTQDGIYRIEVWDVGASGELKDQMDSVYYNCKTGESWRLIDAEQEAQREQDSDGRPKGGACMMHLHTTNPAPVDGVVIIMWMRAPGDTEFHLETFGVTAGEAVGNIPIFAPCAVNVRVYYRPFEADGVLFLPSQYYPDGEYGTPPEWQPDNPSYHTTFPDWPLPEVNNSD